jgi:sugar lactone lactonase YvrE
MKIPSKVPFPVFIVALLCALPAQGALKFGDILVTDNESNHIVRVVPETGEQIQFADRGDVALCSVLPTSFAPQGLATDRESFVYSVNVAQLPFPAPAEVIRFDADGNCSPVTSGVDVVESDDVLIEAEGTLIVTTLRCPSCGAGSPPALLRVDPETGAQTQLSFGGLLEDPELLAVDPVDGTIFVADDGNPGQGILPLILAVDPVSGQQTLLSQGDLLFNLSGLAFEGPDSLVATDRGNSAAAAAPASETKVIRIDLTLAFPAPNQSRVDDPATLPDFEGSRAEYDGIEIDRNGNLVVGVQVDGPVGVSLGPNGGVIRMDPGTGGQMLVTFGGPSLLGVLGILEGADGVAIIPEPSPGFLHIAALASLIAIRKWGSPGKR